MTRVPVKPSLYRWAEQRSGLAADELDARFPRLRAWEAGKAQPTLRQLEEFARATWTPVGYFFLDQPPDEPLPIPDLRSGRLRRRRPSPHLLDTIYSCQRRQEWFRDYARASGDEPLAFVGCLTTKTSAAAAAGRIRKDLNFEVDQREAANVDDALREFSACAEALGVLVMRNGVVGSNTHRKLNPEEFRGFALADDLAPLVFLNAADSKSAQMFTLAHELGHLWLGKSALDDSTVAVEPDDAVERWCNAVAAEVLVPMAFLRKEVQGRPDLDADLVRLVRRFKVSSLVILRRLLDAELISRRAFESAYKAALDRIPQRAGSSGGDFYRTEISRVGRRFASALVTSTLEGHTLYRDAFRLLGISKDSTFTELGHQLQAIA
ncbi:MAG: ImmA/IrrE family metallo-endopeptidase [Gemmatimonadales bacterium]|nr:ImmA/IrrE family metallo-endopeptidase [Gemmatimonadales bacterium]